MGPAGQHHRAGLVGAPLGADLLHRALQLYADDLGELCFGPKALGALLHLHGQLKAANALGEAGVIVNHIGGAHLAAGGQLFQHQGGKVGPGRVQGGGVAAGAAAYHDHIIDLRHGSSARFFTWSWPPAGPWAARPPGSPSPGRFQTAWRWECSSPGTGRPGRAPRQC